MFQPNHSPTPKTNDTPPADPDFEEKIWRLHQLSVYTRWGVVVLCWLIFAPISLWSMREDIAMMWDYFTWVALRYTLAYNPIAAFCLALCVGLTTAVLIWQSRNILWGLSPAEKYRLGQQVQQISQQGKSHPYWKWIYQKR